MPHNFCYFYTMAVARIKEVTLVLFSIISFNIQAQITRIDTINTTDINLKPSQYATQRLYMYTIGLKLYGLEEFPKILNQVNSNHLVNTPMSGIFVKINDNQISYRLGVNFYTKDISFKNECEECEEATGTVKDFSTKIGFEKNFVYGTLQPYLALDIGYRRNSFKGDVENASSEMYTNPYEAITLKNSFLMSPNFGLKFNPTGHLTLALETGLTVLHSYEKQERIQKEDRSRFFSQYNKWEFLLKPVSMLSLQYNFGLAY